MSKKKDRVTITLDVEMPTFVVRLWDVDKLKLKSRGHDISSKGLSKRFAKHYFAGRIHHVQSKKSVFFNSVSEFHKFIEKHRV